MNISAAEQDVSMVTDMVTFDDLQTYYPPGENIVVVYNLDKDFTANSRDWLGLYTCEYKSARDYITFEWAPKRPQNLDLPYLRQVEFRGRYLRVNPDIGECQFMYVNKNYEVLGTSQKFRFGVRPQSDDDDENSSLVILSSDLEEICSLSSVSNKTGSQSDVLDTYDVVKTIKSLPEMNSQSPQNIHDSITLAGDFNQLPPIISNDINLAGDLSKSSQNNLNSITLAGDLDKTKSEDNLLRLFNPFQDASLLNMERSVVAYQPLFPPGDTLGCKDVVPYQPILPADFFMSGQQSLPIYSVNRTDLGLNIEPMLTMPRGPSLDGATMLACSNTSTRCHDCIEKAVEIETLKAELTVVMGSLKTAQDELRSTGEDLDIKNCVLDELCQQVKNLVHDNSQLALTNDDVITSNIRFSNLSNQNRCLFYHITSAGCRIEELEKQKKNLEALKETLIQHHQKTKTELEIVNSKNENQKKKIATMSNEMVELNQHLDDIMYTLSLQGYSKIVDNNGNKIDLTERKGSVLQLEGWTVALKKKSEHYLSTIAKLEAQVATLQSVRDNLSNELEQRNLTSVDLENKLQAEKENNMRQQKETASVREQCEAAFVTVSELESSLAAEKSQLLQQQEEQAKHEKQLLNNLSDVTEKLESLQKRDQTEKSDRGVQTLKKLHLNKAVNTASNPQTTSSVTQTTGLDGQANKELVQTERGVQTIERRLMCTGLTTSDDKFNATSSVSIASDSDNDEPRNAEKKMKIASHGGARPKTKPRKSPGVAVPDTRTRIRKVNFGKACDSRVAVLNKKLGDGNRNIFKDVVKRGPVISTEIPLDKIDGVILVDQKSSGKSKDMMSGSVANTSHQNNVMAAVDTDCKIDISGTHDIAQSNYKNGTISTESTFKQKVVNCRFVNNLAKANNSEHQDKPITTQPIASPRGIVTVNPDVAPAQTAFQNKVEKSWVDSLQVKQELSSPLLYGNSSVDEWPKIQQAKSTKGPAVSSTSSAGKAKKPEDKSEINPDIKSNRSAGIKPNKTKKARRFIVNLTRNFMDRNPGSNSDWVEYTPRFF